MISSAWLRSPRRPTDDPGAPALEARDLAASYGGDVVLRDVSFALFGGERLAVVGPNGAGKSTLLKVACGLWPASAGSMLIHGHAPRDHLCVAYVPQRADVDWRFPLTVLDVVVMGRAGRLGAFRRPGPRDRSLAHDALDRVGLGPVAGRQIGELSGGQQQRVFVARAVAQEADVLLLDEPLAGLDAPSAADVVSILTRLEGTTVVVALHDLSLASSHFDRALLLRGRMISYGRPQEAFQPALLRQAYGDWVQAFSTVDGTVVAQDAVSPKEIR